MSSELAEPYRKAFNGKLDRLSSLIDRLRVQVAVGGRQEADQDIVTLQVRETENETLRLLLLRGADRMRLNATDEVDLQDSQFLVASDLAISGVGRQVICALASPLSVELSADPYLSAVTLPLIEEIKEPRCGGQAVFERLCEVVVIRLLRYALEQGKVDTGLLSGLAHPRIAAALVAIHEAPGEPWTLERLAEAAGMSRTQFAVTFKNLVGVTPMGYLTGWRLDIAREELEKGKQVKAVANMCGFSSASAISRAFANRFGFPPGKVRRVAVG